MMAKPSTCHAPSRRGTGRSRRVSNRAKSEGEKATVKLSLVNKSSKKLLTWEPPAVSKKLAKEKKPNKSKKPEHDCNNNNKSNVKSNNHCVQKKLGKADIDKKLDDIKKRFFRHQDCTPKKKGRPSRKICLIDENHVQCDCPIIKPEDVAELDNCLKEIDGDQAECFECGVCGAEFCRPTTFEVHLKVHEAESNNRVSALKCKRCHQTFSKSKNMINHIRKKTCAQSQKIAKPINPTWHSCKFCCAFFSVKKSLMRHLRKRRCPMIGRGIDVKDIDRELMAVKATTPHNFFNYEMDDQTVLQYAPAIVASKDENMPVGSMKVTVKMPDMQAEKLLGKRKSIATNCLTANEDLLRLDKQPKKMNKQVTSGTEDLSCMTCKKVFSNRQNMYRHIQLGVCRKVCTCGQVFPSMRDIYLHYQKCPDRKPLPTPVVEKERDPVSCSICEIPFPNTNRLDYHVRHMHFPSLKRDAQPFLLHTSDKGLRKSKLPNKLFRCLECKTDFGVLKTLEDHFLSVHSKLVEKLMRQVDETAKRITKDEIPLQVPLNKAPKQCGGVIITDSQVKQEKGRNHGPVNFVVGPPEVTDLPVDSFKTCSALCNKRGKVSPVGSERPTKGKSSPVYERLRGSMMWLNCQYCPKMMNSRSDMLNHMMMHVALRPYSCVLCGSSYTRISVLSKHIMIHSSCFAYHCRACNRSFRDKISLMFHLRTHEQSRKELKFSCLQCGEHYGKLSSLKRHQVVHVVRKDSHRCNICYKRFTSPTLLYEHSREHVRETVHKCKICWKTFRWANVLYAHERTAHMQNKRNGKSAAVLTKRNVHTPLVCTIAKPSRRRKCK